MYWRPRRVRERWGWQSLRCASATALETCEELVVVETERQASAARVMKPLVQILCFSLGLLAPVLACAGPTPPALPAEAIIAELPRPNSGTFTFAQAEARQREILANVASQPLDGWQNPLSGLAVHVAADDTFFVYASHGLLPGVELPAGRVSIADLQRLLRGTLQYGNPHGVLITSARPLAASRTFPKLLESLFVPGIQIYYLARKL